ncbi:MAG: hypothetical protein Q8P50_04435 [Bacillota bacterium]|nr:hypothetical protein [Bacillota bacterium]
MTTLDKFANPYDFSHAITVRSLFAGRRSELNDVEYYLNHARSAERPISLAIVGAPASGKTSLLNMVEAKAKDAGFCVVRVDLGDDEVGSQLVFFHKVFDAVLTEACTEGAFEGLLGKTYSTYRDGVDALEVPQDKTFCPFAFPLQYARAMKSGNQAAVLSDAVFKRDLVVIQEEMKRAIVVLLDDCDVLAKSKAHLQKLRSVFIGTKGFMLVVTGSPELFSAMDDMFAPIVRQFKKISIEPFHDVGETRTCILQPLETLEGIDPAELFDGNSLQVREIQELTGGRPYEIQLLCHCMFRRVQEGRARKMELTVAVLEDLRGELEKARDVTARPVIKAIRNLNASQLNALRVLIPCDGKATIDQIWFAEFVFPGTVRFSREELESYLLKFIESGILNKDQDFIRFKGDEFDRVYCRYWARNFGVTLRVTQRPFDFFIGTRVGGHLARATKGLQQMGPIRVGATEPPDITEIASHMVAPDSSVDVFKSSLPLATELYWASFDFQGADSVPIVAVTVITPWATVSCWHRWESPTDVAADSLEQLSRMGEELRGRAGTLGGDVKMRIDRIPVITLDQLATSVEKTENSRARTLVADGHVDQAVECYVGKRNTKMAILHGELAVRYGSPHGFENNLGYLYMVAGDFPKARGMFEKAMRDKDAGKGDPPSPGPTQYNLGILEAQEKHFPEALAQLTLAVKHAKSTSELDRKCLCLVVPKEQHDGLSFEEVMNPDLLTTSDAALSVIQSYVTQHLGESCTTEKEPQQ